MGKSKSSKKKSCTDTAATKASKEPAHGTVSDRTQNDGHEKIGTGSDENVSSNGPTPAVGPSAKGPSQSSETNSKSHSEQGSSPAAEQMKGIEYYKNKCNALKANLKATERKCAEKDQIIKQKEEEKYALEAQNLKLTKDLEDLEAKYENSQKEKSWSLPDSEQSPMDVDPTQSDISEQQKEKETDTHQQTIQKHYRPSTPLNWEEGSTSDQEQPSAWDREQPSTSSFHRQCNEGKQHTRKGYHQEEQPHHVGHKQKNFEDQKQSRQPLNRNRWEPNQNYKISRDLSGGRLKLETPEYKIVQEVNGDLFSAPEDSSLAHCVAEDMRMGSGIAVRFRQIFKRVDELLDQRRKQGEVAVLQDTDRYIYYLVTKPVSNGKPTMETLRRSLHAMRDHVEAHSVSKIAMPRIGCGLDRLHWKEVKPLIERIFSDLNVTITVYNLIEDDAASRPSNYNYLTIKEAQFPVVGIAPYTAILCLCAADGSVDPVLHSVDRKFNISYQYQKADKKLGSMLEIIRNNYLICILFVREKIDDVLSFKSLAKSLVQVRKLMDKHEYVYVALQAFHDQRDELLLEKVITLFRCCLNMKPSKELWLCWPKKVENMA